MPWAAHARPAGRRGPDEIPARRARALRQFRDARQESDAALGRPAEARRSRGPVGLRGGGRENLIQRTTTPQGNAPPPMSRSCVWAGGWLAETELERPLASGD